MSDLGSDLAALLNRYSQENGSNTPDFILAAYLLSCLATWNTQVVRRDQWYGMVRHPLGTTSTTPATRDLDKLPTTYDPTRTIGSTGDLPDTTGAAPPEGPPHD